MIPPSAAVPETVWRGAIAEPGRREIPEETPVALVHDAATTGVMMATPADLEDFGVGFSLTEGIIDSPEQITRLETAASELGVEVRMWLEHEPAAALTARRRRLAGPTGCGLCGVESLEEALRPPPPVSPGLVVRPADVQAALAALGPRQALGAATRAVHAAGWWERGAGLVAVREDVGRHNALDKLVGALARAERARGEGLLVLTSRVSVEMVQKAAAMDAQVVAAVSAPTALAVRMAERCGMTLIAIARDDGFEVFTGPERVVPR